MNKLYQFLAGFAFSILFLFPFASAADFLGGENITTNIRDTINRGSLMTGNLTGEMTHLYAFNGGNQTIYRIDTRARSITPLFNVTLFTGDQFLGTCGMNSSYGMVANFLCSQIITGSNTNITAWNESGSFLGYVGTAGPEAGVTIGGLWTNGTNTSAPVWFATRPSTSTIRVYSSTFVNVQNITAPCANLTGGIWSNSSGVPVSHLWVGCSGNATYQVINLNGVQVSNVNNTPVINGVKLGIVGNFSGRPDGHLWISNVTLTVLQNIFNDTTAPTCDNLSVNASYVGAGQNVSINARCWDNGRLGHVWLETNQSGQLVNETLPGRIIAGRYNDSLLLNVNFSIANGTLCNNIVSFRVFANDSRGNTANSSTRNFTAIPFILSSSAAGSGIGNVGCGINTINFTFPMSRGDNYTVLLPPNANATGQRQCNYNVSNALLSRVFNGSAFCQLNVTSASTVSGQFILIMLTGSFSIDIPPNLPAGIAIATLTTLVVVYRVVTRRRFGR